MTTTTEDRASALRASLDDAARLLGEKSELIAVMLAALKDVNALVSEAAQTGFNYKTGDWAERLFASQWNTSEAIRMAEGRKRISLADRAALSRTEERQ